MHSNSFCGEASITTHKYRYMEGYKHFRFRQVV